MIATTSLIATSRRVTRRGSRRHCVVTALVVASLSSLPLSRFVIFLDSDEVTLDEVLPLL